MAQLQYPDKEPALNSSSRQGDPRGEIRRLIGEAKERKDEFLAYLLSLALAHASEKAAMEAYMSEEPAEPDA